MINPEHLEHSMSKMTITRHEEKFGASSSTKLLNGYPDRSCESKGIEENGFGEDGGEDHDKSKIFNITNKLQLYKRIFLGILRFLAEF